MKTAYLVILNAILNIILGDRHNTMAKISTYQADGADMNAVIKRFGHVADFKILLSKDRGIGYRVTGRGRDIGIMLMSI